MNIFQAIWNWLNGNKTIIGLFIAWLVSKVWFVDIVGAPIAEILEYIGGLLAGVGVAHKIAKANTQPGPNQ